MNVSAHRISPIEVESALVDHPKVAEAAVYGRTDATTGPGDRRLCHAQVRRGGPLEMLDELREDLMRTRAPTTL
jgi:acetyl-CoA synthetase